MIFWENTANKKNDYNYISISPNKGNINKYNRTTNNDEPNDDESNVGESK